MKKALKVMIIGMLCLIIAGCFVACGEENKEENKVKEFSGLSFEDQTVYYDGQAHELTVKNAPSGATIEYSGNTATKIGEYSATATVSMDGYNTKTLKAKLVILPSPDLFVAARANAKNDAAQNYDFFLNFAGTVGVLGINETANANYDGKYRYDSSTGNLTFKRVTSGLLLVDSTEFIYTQNDSKIKVVANDKGEVKKTSIVANNKDGLDLVNMPFVALVDGIKKDNVTKIALTGRSDYKYVATLALKSDNSLVSKLFSYIEKLGTRVEMSGVSFTNPMGIQIFFNIGADEKLVDFKLSADVSFPVKGVTATLKLTYLQKANNTKISVPSTQGIIVGATAIEKELSVIDAAFDKLKAASAYSLDLKAENEFDPGWNVTATVDKYIARLYKNTNAETGMVDFNHSFEYKAHTDTDDKDTFKFTVGNIKDGSVYRISRKGGNTNEQLDGITVDGQFDYLTAVARVASGDVDCIRKAQKDGSTFYYIYVNDQATHGVQRKITDLINSNPTNNVTDVENYFNAAQNKIDESEMTVEIKDGDIVSVTIKTQLRYQPTGGDYTEENIILTNTITLNVNNKLSAAQSYKAPQGVATTLGHIGLNNAKFYIL